uniref:uncharacterized protein LOC122776913 isoform X1 n=1 Tax=Solea senegalensis TaxID=28829 RepID=UPI001CD8F764|nr:uncharacterized protein LOC122776913 isoform X1 [Solea senegalensis]
MTERRMLVFLTLLCVLCCVLGPSLAYKLNCTYSKTPEGHMYSVSPPSSCNKNDTADFSWSHNKTVLATRETRVPGVVTSNVTTVVIDRYVHKMEYEVNCENRLARASLYGLCVSSPQDWEHYPANCSAIEEEIKGDQRREGEDVLQVTVSEMRSLLEATSLEREAVFVSSMLLCHKTVSFISIVFVANPTTVKMVVGLVLAVAVAGGLIYKFRNCIKSGWVKLRGVKETEGTSTVVYVSDGLTQ